MATTFALGTKVRCKATVRDVDGNLVDPPNLTLTVQRPSGSNTAYTLAANEVQRLSLGIFYVDYKTDETGKFWVGADPDNPDLYNEESFTVRARHVAA